MPRISTNRQGKRVFQWRNMLFQRQIHRMPMSPGLHRHQVLNPSHSNLLKRSTDSHQSKLYLLLLRTQSNQLLPNQPQNMSPLKLSQNSHQSRLFGSLTQFRQTQTRTLHLSDFPNFVWRKGRSLPDLLHSLYPDPQKTQRPVPANHLRSRHQKQQWLHSQSMGQFSPKNHGKWPVVTKGEPNIWRRWSERKWLESRATSRKPTSDHLVHIRAVPGRKLLGHFYHRNERTYAFRKHRSVFVHHTKQILVHTFKRGHSQTVCNQSWRVPSWQLTH